MTRLTIITILLSINTFLFAQEKSKTPLSFEPVIGFGISSMLLTGEVINDFDSFSRNFDLKKESLGYLGCYVKRPFGSKVQIKTGLTFGLERLFYTISTSSTKSNIPITTSNIIDQEMNLFRVSIPVLFDFDLKESPWFFSVGISGSLVTRTSLKSTITYFDIGKKESIINDEPTPLKKNISCNLGIGRKVNFVNADSALLVSLKSNYFLGPDDQRFFKVVGSNFIFALEIGYEF